MIALLAVMKNYPSNIFLIYPQNKHSFFRTVKVGSLVLIADGTVVTIVKEIKDVGDNYKSLLQ